MMKNLLVRAEPIFLTAFFILFCLVIAVILGGCSSQPTIEPTKVKYEMTLNGFIDGDDFQGVALGDSKKTHTILLNSVVDVNFFTLQSCHRFEKFEDIDKQNMFGRWLKINRQYQWQYNLAPGLEDTGDCPVRMCAYSKTVGAPPVACAAADFRSDKYTLPATNMCNGDFGPTSGSNLCQTQVGLKERLAFKEAVVMAPKLPADQLGQMNWIKNQCQGSFDSTGMTFTYTVPSTECYAVFMQKASPYKRAKLTVFPYDLPQYSGAK